MRELLAEDGGPLSDTDLSPHGFSIMDPWLRDAEVPPFPRMHTLCIRRAEECMELLPPPMFLDNTPQEEIERGMAEYEAEVAA